MVDGAVGPVARLVGEPEADVIGDDAASVRGEAADQVPEEERPGGRSVYEDEGRAAPLVQVVHPAHGQPEIAAPERVLIAIQPVRILRERRGVGVSDRVEAAAWVAVDARVAAGGAAHRASLRKAQSVSVCRIKPRIPSATTALPMAPQS